MTETGRQIEARIVGMMDEIGKRKPVLRTVLQQTGATSLDEYVQSFPHKPEEAIQPRADYIEVVTAETQRLLGADMAAKVHQRVEKRSDVNTPYHMGVDTQPVTSQSTHVYALGEEPGAAMVALAGGAVPMSNYSFPLGLWLAREEEKHVGQGQTKKGPVKINILPTRSGKNNTFVALHPPFTGKMVEATRGRVGGMFGQGVITRTERNSIGALLRNVYEDPDILEQATYADQATKINYRLWRMLYADEAREAIPELAFLQLETIVNPLLLRDIENNNSLVHAMLFEPELRKTLLGSPHLDGVRGCWDSQRPYLGTTFFWGIDSRGEGITLYYVESEGKAILRGKGITDLPLEPEAVSAALEQQAIMPALFTSFSALTFARGNVPYGGFQQTDYLTAMRAGLATSLEQTGNIGWAEKVRKIQTENYSAGMMPIIGRYDDTSVRPVGAMEILSKGGLNSDQAQTLRRTTVTEASLMALPAVYSLVVPEAERDPHFSAVTANDIYKAVKPNVVELRV